MPAIGDFDQSFLGGTGQLHSQIQAYSATIKLDLGGAEVTSLSGYNQFKQHGVIDYTPIYGYFTKNGFPGTGFNGFGVSGTPDVIDPIARNYSQEFRLSSPTGRRLEWLAGAFYTHQSARNTAAILAVDETTLQHVGTFWDAKSNTTFDDYAVFADATYHFTGRFSLQLGARQSWIRQTQSEDFEGPFNLVFLGFPEVFVTPKAHDHDQAFTYLVAPTFKFTRNLMAYARFSSGYRAGGLNLAVAPGTPPTFKPDTTQNYELGLKGDLFQHALTIDASAYYIRWKDVQQILLNPAFQGYVDNAGAAKSEGVELAVDAHPVKALTLSGWFAYDNAVLTKGFPASSTAFGQKGDRLPYSSRYSGRLSADLNVPLGERLSGSLGASLSYVGKRIGAFAYGSPVREIYPAYTQIDLRAGLTRDQWELNLFVTNLTDRRGLIGGGIGTLYPNAFQYIRPRAFGASITRSF
jgi:outer membrane receptor protein involved in Fe transport